nr:unnamed protein product [Haemonchus contortus]
MHTPLGAHRVSFHAGLSFHVSMSILALETEIASSSALLYHESEFGEKEFSFQVLSIKGVSGMTHPSFFARLSRKAVRLFYACEAVF